MPRVPERPERPVHGQGRRNRSWRNPQAEFVRSEEGIFRNAGIRAFEISLGRLLDYAQKGTIPNERVDEVYGSVLKSLEEIERNYPHNEQQRAIIGELRQALEQKDIKLLQRLLHTKTCGLKFSPYIPLGPE